VGCTSACGSTAPPSQKYLRYGFGLRIQSKVREQFRVEGLGVLQKYLGCGLGLRVQGLGV